MTTLTITITPELKAFLEEQVGSGNYSSSSEFISVLLKKKKLEKLLLQRIDAVERGDADEMTREHWNKMRADLVARHKKRAGNAKEQKSQKTESRPKRNGKNSQVHRPR